MYLATILLLAQMLGLMHGTVHGAANGAALHAVVREARLMLKVKLPEPQFAASNQQTKTRLGVLFSSHTSASDCLLYDQASHGSAALHVMVFTLPVLLPSFAVAIFAGDALARWAALFDARGPPRTC